MSSFHLPNFDLDKHVNVSHMLNPTPNSKENETKSNQNVAVRPKGVMDPFLKGHGDSRYLRFWSLFRVPKPSIFRALGK